ncbi:hypothetical protein BSV1_M55 (plasmid) [Borreliella finlandensis]|uniref:Uncharacterized protein n=1 Tax=Borreliella finlandensis TaxID=498741 RepID=A0A826GWD6_9SPIR|nr:hypothetical protein BSV1_M55 [Borreliella finlandensis]
MQKKEIECQRLLKAVCFLKAKYDDCAKSKDQKHINLEIYWLV